MRRKLSRSLAAAALAAAMACSHPPAPAKTAAAVPDAQAVDAIYAGGDIVTVNDAQPTVR